MPRRVCFGWRRALAGLCECDTIAGMSERATRRIGILGGSFDPVHFGHLYLTREASDRLGLDEVVMIPAWNQPLKSEDAAPAEHRLAMLRLAVEAENAALRAGVVAGGNDAPRRAPRISVSAIEVDRRGLSYTIDTVEVLKATFPEGAELFFLAGADALGTLPFWKRYRDLCRLVRFTIVTRPGHELRVPEALARWVYVLAVPPFDASSTAIRRAIRAEGPDHPMLTRMLPTRVHRYIRAHGLYAGEIDMSDARAAATPETAAIPADATESSATPPVTSIAKIGEHAGGRVTLRGWLMNKRGKGKLQFLIVRDGSGMVQAVAFKKNLDEATFEAIKRLGIESSIELTGEVKPDSRAPGGFELGIDGFEVISAATEEYPIGKKEHGPDFLLGHRHLWLRSKKQWAILRIRSEVESAIHDFFYERDFVRTDAPILTPNACEGTSTLFDLDYFEEGKAYLTQSGQLYAEALAMALGKVYTFGPTFRAEQSKTRRHLTEFWMVEPEIAFANLDDVMDLAEAFLCAIVKRCLDRCQTELKVLERDLSKLEGIKAPFPRISYDEAVKMLNDGGHPFEWGGDLGAADETYLSNLYDKPLMIHRYPKEVKAFYMKRDPNDDRVALCVDVLAPEGRGEIIGGSAREDDLDALNERIAAHGLPEEAFRWYNDLRRFGSVPHGGFGLGIERTVGWIAGREHVRECIPFPRMLHRIYP